MVYDGVLVSPDVPLLHSTNRAFRYGDGLFETIRFHKGEPLHWESHYQRLLKGMAVLKMASGSFPSRQSMRDSIIDLVVKNRIFADARVRLTVFRKGEGSTRRIECRCRGSSKPRIFTRRDIHFPKRD
ncbi:aminodeoxychorismate lyase [Geofilum rubicundum JCM 15548]|uniref:Aminodeoxychorismate lyase n=1 Tax=Geofilum rubicundum JCM 15548 TaxID=1236989 RepID=A0A0E9M184_9BACT|nr:aminodeoxychorismate lyase [Geofilum rubicundum JCM 15548]